MQRPSVELVVAKTAKLRPALRRVTSACLSCSSSPKKVTPRLCCSLVNALSSSRTAYRLRLRSSPRTLTPSFLLSEKSHAASLLLACKRARNAPTCYQLFSVSSGQVLCLSSGGKRVNVPCGRAAMKHKIGNYIFTKNTQAPGKSLCVL